VERAGGHVALEDLAEPREETGCDGAGDLPLEGLVPALLEERSLEEPFEADLVGGVLNLAASRSRAEVCAASSAMSSGSGSSEGPELTEQSSMADEVGIASDGRSAPPRLLRCRLSHISRYVLLAVQGDSVFVVAERAPSKV
jgi:hypothetical protein